MCIFTYVHIPATRRYNQRLNKSSWQFPGEPVLLEHVGQTSPIPDHSTHCKHKIVGWDLLGRSKIYTDRTEIDIVVGSTCLRDKPIWGQIRQTMKVTTTRSRADSKSIFITWNPRLLLCRCILFCVVHVTSTRNHECTSKKNSTL